MWETERGMRGESGGKHTDGRGDEERCAGRGMGRAKLKKDEDMHSLPTWPRSCAQYGTHPCFTPPPFLYFHSITASPSPAHQSLHRLSVRDPGYLPPSAHCPGDQIPTRPSVHSSDRSRRQVPRSRSHPTTLVRTTFPPYLIPQYLHAVRITLFITLSPARSRSSLGRRTVHNPYQSVRQIQRLYQQRPHQGQLEPTIPYSLPVLRHPGLPFVPSSASLPSP